MDLQIDQLTDIATCRVGIAANNMITTTITATAVATTTN